MKVDRHPHWRRATTRWAHRVRVVEAVVLLAVAGVAQRWVPMTRWSRVIGRAGAVPDSWRGQRIEVLPLRWASVTERKAVQVVTSASRIVPWNPSCLAEATAGQVMLRQFGSPGVVVIGIRPNEAAPERPWLAHAWLLGRHGALTGGRAARGFTATTVFEVRAGLAASDVDLRPGAGEPAGSQGSARP